MTRRVSSTLIKESLSEGTEPFSNAKALHASNAGSAIARRGDNSALLRDPFRLIRWVLAQAGMAAMLGSQAFAATFTQTPDLGPFWQPLGGGGTYVYANDFIAPDDGTVSELGMWLVILSGAGSDIRFEIYGSLGGNPANGPDTSNVLATTGVLSGLGTASLDFYSAPTLSGGTPLVAGQTYWFAGNAVGVPSIGSFRTGGHGFDGNGSFWYSNDPSGLNFDGRNRLPEIAFSVTTTSCFAIDAIDDQFSVINDGISFDFLVLENDECNDDSPISVIELPGDLLPDRGGSAATDGATVSYTPAAGFVGFEEFTYSAEDAGLEGDPPTVDLDTAVIVVDVREDISPDAVDDVATTLQNQATIIDVLANDALGNAPNGVGIETAPANGIATQQADDTIRYVPNLDFFGEDSFEYRLTDANGDSDVATVTVGVFFVGGQVPIDIIPDNLNLNAGQGAGIEIVILSVGESFDAPNVIDPLSLKFGPRQGNIWGSPRVRDVDGDGDGDLLVKFLMQQSGIACGDTHATLTGRTFDFESISGTDTINTFNCPRVRKRH